MTESGDEAPGIDSIKADVSTPSNAVERLATHEAEAYGQRKSKATPTELHHAAAQPPSRGAEQAMARFETQVAERDQEIRVCAGTPLGSPQNTPDSLNLTTTWFTTMQFRISWSL